MSHISPESQKMIALLKAMGQEIPAEWLDPDSPITYPEELKPRPNPHCGCSYDMVTCKNEHIPFASCVGFPSFRQVPDFCRLKGRYFRHEPKHDSWFQERAWVYCGEVIEGGYGSPKDVAFVQHSSGQDYGVRTVQYYEKERFGQPANLHYQKYIKQLAPRRTVLFWQALKKQFNDMDVGIRNESANIITINARLPDVIKQGRMWLHNADAIHANEPQEILCWCCQQKPAIDINNNNDQQQQKPQQEQSPENVESNTNTTTTTTTNNNPDQIDGEQKPTKQAPPPPKRGHAARKAAKEKLQQAQAAGQNKKATTTPTTAATTTTPANGFLTCKTCAAAKYCSIECQKRHAEQHRGVCEEMKWVKFFSMLRRWQDTCRAQQLEKAEIAWNTTRSARERADEKAKANFFQLQVDLIFASHFFTLAALKFDDYYPPTEQQPRYIYDPKHDELVVMDKPTKELFANYSQRIKKFREYMSVMSGSKGKYVSSFEIRPK